MCAVFLGCVAAITAVALLYLGMAVPGLLIDSGVEDFEGDERRIADSFRSYEMWRKFGAGPEAYIVTGASVTEIERCPGSPPYDSKSLSPYGTMISGKIQVHTIFGIPYRSIETTCGRATAG